MSNKQKLRNETIIATKKAHSLDRHETGTQNAIKSLKQAYLN